MHHKHIPPFVLIIIVIVAILAFAIAFRAPSEGRATELVVRWQKAQITPCCCIKTDPNGIKRDHTALYFVRGTEECKCYPNLNWVPTDLGTCHVRSRR